MFYIFDMLNGRGDISSARALVFTSLDEARTAAERALRDSSSAYAVDIWNDTGRVGHFARQDEGGRLPV